MTATMSRGGTADGPAAVAGELRRLADDLRAVPGVVAAWAFGSAVEGARHTRGELGLLVVQRTRAQGVDRALRLARALELRMPADVLVVTPSELRAGGRRVRRACRGRRIL